VIPIEEKAREFAIYWHDSIKQVRKYTGAAYWTHPEAVVALVKSVSHTEEMLAAAWLHDVVEDTPCLAGDILDEFGTHVAILVSYLTDVSRPTDGNRERRKRIDREHIAGAPVQAKTVKLADLIDNSKSITKFDPDFARIYLREKRLLLDEALKEGDSTLWAMADDIVRANL
jgi:(p)ppGpp synthase/HD superfamily hydrolase